jgi:hypothetical protein
MRQILTVSDGRHNPVTSVIGPRLLIHPPSPAEGVGVDAPVDPAWVVTAEPAQLGAERRIPVRLGRLVALGRTVLADDPSGQPLTEAQHALQMVHGAAAACRAQQIPRASSRSASFSSSASATTA